MIQQSRYGAGHVSQVEQHSERCNLEEYKARLCRPSLATVSIALLALGTEGSIPRPSEALTTTPPEAGRENTTSYSVAALTGLEYVGPLY